MLAAKARAVLHGRYYVSCEDVRAVAVPVLRHRIITNFNAEAEGIKPDDIVRRLTDIIPATRRRQLERAEAGGSGCQSIAVLTADAAWSYHPSPATDACQWTTHNAISTP